MTPVLVSDSRRAAPAEGQPVGYRSITSQMSDGSNSSSSSNGIPLAQTPPEIQIGQYVPSAGPAAALVIGELEQHHVCGGEKREGLPLQALAESSSYGKSPLPELPDERSKRRAHGTAAPFRLV